MTKPETTSSPSAGAMRAESDIVNLMKENFYFQYTPETPLWCIALIIDQHTQANQADVDSLVEAAREVEKLRVEGHTQAGWDLKPPKCALCDALDRLQSALKPFPKKGE